MTRKRNRYAGLNAAQKNDFVRLSPKEWKEFFDNSNARTLRKTYGQLCRRGGPEWERIKDMFIQALKDKSD
jgi:hypothetical protein